MATSIRQLVTRHIWSVPGETGWGSTVLRCRWYLKQRFEYKILIIYHLHWKELGKALQLWYQGYSWNSVNIYINIMNIIKLFLMGYSCFIILSVSAVWQHESAIFTHISPLSWASLPPYTHVGHHRAASWVPCAIWQVPTSYLFYTWQCIYVSPNLSIHPYHTTHHVHTSSLYICVSIPAQKIGYNFLRFHIYMH